MKKILLFITLGFLINNWASSYQNEIAAKFLTCGARVGLGAAIIYNTPSIAQYIASKAKNINKMLYSPTELAAIIATAMTGLNIIVNGLQNFD